MPRIHGNKSEYLIKQEKLARFLFWLLFLVFAIIGFIQIVLSIIYRGQHLKSLIVVAVFSSVVLYIVKRAEKKAVEGLKFRRGRKGEGAIFYELLKLSKDFHVLQDININGKSNIDFVVVGPTGIFAIEVKSHRGYINFNGEELTLNGQIFKEKNVLRQAMSEAMDIRNVLEAKLGQKYFVNPILVFSNNRTTVKFGLYPQKGVVVVGKRFLRKAIFNERRKLSPERIKVISECLDRYVNKNK